jgi:hypothetical protein
MSETSEVFAALDDQLEEIRHARAALDDREDAIHRARAELQVAFGGAPPPASGRGRRAAQARPTRAGIQQKAAQHHVDAIHDYLQKHGTARQADIAKDLGLNSGTASLALRQLEEDRAVVPQERKDRGSVVWDFAAANPRTSDGSRTGRLASSR